MAVQEKGKAKTRRVPSIQTINNCVLILAVILSIVAIVTLTRVFQQSERTEAAHQNYEECVDAVNEFLSASESLTSQSRMFVVTGRRLYADNYLHELLSAQRRNDAMDTIENHVEDVRAQEALIRAFTASNALADRELYAMRLVADATDMGNVPKQLEQVRIHEADAALTNERKLEVATDLVVGDGYRKYKSIIEQSLEACSTELFSHLQSEEQECNRKLENLLANLRIIVILLVCLMASAVVANHALVVRPMSMHDKSIQKQEPLKPVGSREVQNVVRSYNHMYEENNYRTLILEREASTDPLTGLLNRGSYDKLLEQLGSNIVLLLVDVDNFKGVNDTFGHETGDKVLQKVATQIRYQIRYTDYVCRLGGDEFAVLMAETRNVSPEIIALKITNLAHELLDTSDGLPQITLSIGVAFGERLPLAGNIYRAADAALYAAKDAGRNCFRFFNESYWDTDETLHQDASTS